MAVSEVGARETPASIRNYVLDASLPCKHVKQHKARLSELGSNPPVVAHPPTDPHTSL